MKEKKIYVANDGTEFKTKEECLKYEETCPDEPVMLKTFDPVILKKTVEYHIDSIKDGSYHEDNDDKQYIYEAAIEMFYGDDVWDWKNSKI